MDTEKRVCKTCKEPKQLGTEFPTNRTNGTEYYRRECKACFNKVKKLYRKSYAALCADNPEHREYRNSQERARRKKPEFVSRFIMSDSKKSDKLKHRENDLDREYVEAVIFGGCSYCGETELRMTLDRVDNTKGHTKDNVRAACIRCNLVRGDMPFPAWLFLVDRIRQAREEGLFHGWK